MDSNNVRKGYAVPMVEAYKHLLAVPNSGISAEGVMRCVSEVLNSEFPVLFPGDEKAAIAGQIMNAFDMKNQSALDALWVFAEAIVGIFIEVERRDTSSFAPGNRRFQLLISALEMVDSQRMMNISQLAATAGVSRQTIKDAVIDGRIPAEKYGREYLIKADDAAVFVASRRSEKPQDES